MADVPTSWGPPITHSSATIAFTGIDLASSGLSLQLWGRLLLVETPGDPHGKPLLVAPPCLSSRLPLTLTVGAPGVELCSRPLRHVAVEFGKMPLQFTNGVRDEKKGCHGKQPRHRGRVITGAIAWKLHLQ